MLTAPIPNIEIKEFEVSLSARVCTTHPPHDPDHHVSHTIISPTTSKTVFLAIANGLTLGHSTIEIVPKNAPSWESLDDGEVRSALANARLAELSGLAVDPASQGHGVATALLRAQLNWLLRHPDLLAVAIVWRGSKGTSHIAQRLGIWVAETPDGSQDYYKYSHLAALNF